METPSVPGDGPGQVNRNETKAGKTAGKAAGTAEDTARTTTGGNTEGAPGAARARGRVAVLPGRAAALARLVTLRRFLRAAPVAAAAVAGVVVGRLTARKR